MPSAAIADAPLFSNKSNIFFNKNRHRLAVLPPPVDFVENFNPIY